MAALHEVLTCKLQAESMKILTVRCMARCKSAVDFTGTCRTVATSSPVHSSDMSTVVVGYAQDATALLEAIFGSSFPQLSIAMLSHCSSHDAPHVTAARLILGIDFATLPTASALSIAAGT